MSTIKIVTDSGAQINRNELMRNHITIINLPITIDGHLYGYVNQMSPQKFVELLNRSKDRPVIGKVNADNLKELYDQLGADGSQILSIHLSSRLTNTYKIAKAAAAKSSAQVTVVDSEVTASGLAYQVETAEKLVRQGKSLE